MRILIVDDEPSIRFSVVELLGASHSVTEAEHAPRALELLESQPFDLVISDMNMPAMSGLQLLEEVRARHPAVVFVLMTAFGDERLAVRALRDGAYDYVPKPFDNEELRALARRVHEMLSLRSENERLRTELADRYGEMIGSAPSMQRVYDLIKRAAPTDASVLITGESGTGKELAARALHNESRRAKKPFVALNCSALPSELIESELFGHMRGAFTGADRDKTGLFEAAEGGTIFLDEIGELAPAAQAKLLRALEERVVTPVGDTREKEIDVRVIAATHRDLMQSSFRNDLLYRLKVITLEMPPLREKREDIFAIAAHFIAALAKRHGRPALPLSDAARNALLAYGWPGNVRELRNALERAIVLAAGDSIEVSDLPPQVWESRTALPPTDAVLSNVSFMDARDRALEGFDRAYLTAALEQNGGNVSATARAIGMHRQSLQKMLKRLGISAADSD
ncbi:MAG TPA: sigma-54 dependent transcriptional regulator [Longimicrobiales bacterium]|nr:sigma-54 dependent transcriptional regulator [Longimicrobiales bacterium]